MSKRLGVAVFGLGRAGSIHLKNVVRNYTLELLYVIDVLVDKAEAAVKSYNQEQCVVLSPSEKDKVLNDERLDFVMVCTPTDTHEEICVAALKAGKHVFCEKPVACTDEAAGRVYDAASEMGKKLFCSFNRRFDPSVRKVYNQLADVGQVQVVKTCARDSPFPPLAYLKLSGGVFHDCLVHDIDLACWVSSSYPSSVYAAAYCHNKDIAAMGDVDTVAAVLKFDNGTLAIIDTSRDSCYGYDQRLEVYGDKGMLLNQNQRSDNLTYESRPGASQGRMYNSFNDRYEDSYIMALDYFCRAIREGFDVELTKENTLNVSKIATALEESSKSGKQITMSY